MYTAASAQAGFTPTWKTKSVPALLPCTSSGPRGRRLDSMTLDGDHEASGERYCVTSL
jgi:hypothetical protein